ncbi:MAG TPA: hypothetical protein VLT83_07925 [Opitutaceae bacterium]|nr:hypothetical protein [Opitutaceae bacterium]
MKPSVASVSQIRCRPRGFSRYLLWSALAASVVVGALPAPGSAPAPSVPHTRAGNPGGTVSPEVAAAQKAVADLEARLHGLQTQMADLKAQEPQAPGQNATEAERKKYQKAHIEWQNRVDKLQHQIDSVQQQLAAAREKLQALVG